MAEAHDEHRAARHQVVHRQVHGVGVFAAHLWRHLSREDAVSAVDPGQRKGQRCQRLHQRCAHMATAEQSHWRLRSRQVSLQAACIGQRDLLQGHMHHTATTLPQTGAERVPLRADQRPAPQRRTGMRGQLPLQLPPTDGADLRVCEHGHPGTGFTGAGAFHPGYPHQHTRLVQQLPQQTDQISFHICFKNSPSIVLTAGR